MICYLVFYLIVRNIVKARNPGKLHIMTYTHYVISKCLFLKISTINLEEEKVTQCLLDLFKAGNVFVFWCSPFNTLKMNRKLL